MREIGEGRKRDRQTDRQMDRQTDRQRVKNSKIYAEKERKYWKIRKKKV